FYGLFFKLNKRYISHLVVQANWIREKISEKFGVENNKIEVIAPQVEIFKYISLEFNKIRPVENVFFYPANAYTYKNHLIIIKALNYLGSVYIKKHRIKVVFTINNSESNYLQSMVLNYNLQDVVSFIGRIPRADVYSLLIKSKALLFPSKLETYGLPLKEARQLGVFIVASKLDYATEVLEGYEYKRLCSPDSAKEWASAIKEIIENKIDVGNTVTRDNIKESDLFSDFIKSKIME
ncbi:glycosyltransferase family 4 protein, partial [Escherichia coli]|nr:glycosyltransferase family 4 protein [Escherichia coli]